jgi:hypothetical protein
MVKITKVSRRKNAIFYKKAAVSLLLCFLLFLGVSWLSWFISVVSGGSGSSSRSNRGGVGVVEQPLPKIKGVPKPPSLQLKQQTTSILSQLDRLTNEIPLSPPDNNDGDDTASKFFATLRKECIPGRDDTNGDVNPTTHRKRECLRHVPLGKHIGDGYELEERMKQQKPRIGIMIPPGFIGESFADWVAGALRSTGDDIHMTVEIIPTSHVPVYGYGKSHGYTKLIRFVTLPLSLAVYDAYLIASSKAMNRRGEGENSLLDTLDRMEAGKKPSIATIGTIVQLLLRWHCRLSRE